MVQDDNQGKHEQRIKQYMGVDDIGELTEGVWEYHSESIKRNAHYLFYPDNFNELKIVFDWLLKVFKSDLEPAYSALFMLDELAIIMKNAKEIHPWGLLDAEARGDKIKSIIAAIEGLEEMLQDERIPPLPEVTWFLGSSRGMWLDREVARVTHKWCRANKVHHPTVLGIGDLFNSLKKHMESNLSLKKATRKHKTGDVEARIFARRMKESMRHVFKLKNNPNAVIAALVRMAFPEVVGVTAEKVQEW